MSLAEGDVLLRKSLRQLASWKYLRDERGSQTRRNATGE
jgi:hypothetical protein